MPTREQVLRKRRAGGRARERLKGVLVIDFVVPDYYAARPKPCMGGWGRGIINITPSGKVLPCHAAESIAGPRLRQCARQALARHLAGSDAFQTFRGTGWMREPCRSCEFREVDWGGCRCQAFAFAGAAGEADPACAQVAATTQAFTQRRSRRVEPHRRRLPLPQSACGRQQQRVSNRQGCGALNASRLANWHVDEAAHAPGMRARRAAA